MKISHFKLIKYPNCQVRSLTVFNGSLLHFYQKISQKQFKFYLEAKPILKIQ